MSLETKDFHAISLTTVVWEPKHVVDARKI